MRRIRWLAAATIVVAIALGASPAQATTAPSAEPRATMAGATVRASVAWDGSQAHGDSGSGVSISADGRFVAFDSEAPDLVAADTNGVSDVFVRDLVMGTTERVSVSSGGAEGSGPSSSPSISADGRFVAFGSDAANLVGRDRNGVADIFVRDRLQGTTRLVSRSRHGTPGNGSSDDPDLSADGRFVAFASSSSNLVRHDRNRTEDVFVKDLVTGTLDLASVAWNGDQANSFCIEASVSDDGRVVGFMSPASNLVEAQDTNGADNIYVRDLDRKTTVLASAGPDGGFIEAESGDPAVSGDGRSIAFDSNGPLLALPWCPGGYHVYERDLATGAMAWVDRNADGGMSDGFSVDPALSTDGRSVAFRSDSIDLVPGDTNGTSDVFVREVAAGVTERLSVSSSGRQGNRASGLSGVAFTDDGMFAAFSSFASNLVRRDTNGSADVFRRGPRSL